MPLTRPEQLQHVLTAPLIKKKLGSMASHLRRGKPSGLVVFSSIKGERVRFLPAGERKAAGYLSRLRLDELICSRETGKIRVDIDLLITSGHVTPAPDREELERFSEIQARNRKLIGGNVALAEDKNKAILTLYTQLPDATLSIEAAEQVQDPNDWPRLAKALGAAGLAACQIQFDIKSGMALSQNGQSKPFAQLLQLFEGS